MSDQSPLPGASSSSITSSMPAMPPLSAVPSVPNGFMPPRMTSFRGCYPSVNEYAAAPAAVKDLEAFSDYTTVFGSTAPPRAMVVEALSAALAWRLMRHQTDEWAAYVRARDGMAWKRAFTLLDELKPLFLWAAKSGAFKEKHRALCMLFAAPAERVARAVKTRAKNAKAAAAEEADKAAAAPTAPAVAAPVAPPAPAAATPTSVVVNLK